MYPMIGVAFAKPDETALPIVKMPLLDTRVSKPGQRRYPKPSGPAATSGDTRALFSRRAVIVWYIVSPDPDNPEIDGLLSPAASSPSDHGTGRRFAGIDGGTIAPFIGKHKRVSWQPPCDEKEKFTEKLTKPAFHDTPLVSGMDASRKSRSKF